MTSARLTDLFADGASLVVFHIVNLEHCECQLVDRPNKKLIIRLVAILETQNDTRIFITFGGRNKSKISYVFAARNVTDNVDDRFLYLASSLGQRLHVSGPGPLINLPPPWLATYCSLVV
ncbi:hypothetical protein [Methylobacterium nodulans]|uniref:Uncharacterized protein n=1 Tax=Methylobacterium nodulans (strain LMG 21967 / CNCM I-2342 / ORS 2060) TaxID=460265 RepID=B8IDS3_METNO|nr:hypothetical protein [Methylobacterium nodulans]ACL55645.1 hypothetical protein Mnod_0608 [Methylobacterium nodulans ORS 2060]